MKKAYRIIGSIIIILVCIIFGINVYIAVRRAVFKEKAPKVFGYLLAVCISESMEPVFSSGDLLLVKEEKDYAVGDVIMFYNGESYITHRIIFEESTGGIMTQGDANSVPDGAYTYKENITGRVIRVMRGAGDVILFLKTPLGMFTATAIVILLVEIPDIFGTGEGPRKRRKKRKKRKKYESKRA